MKKIITKGALLLCTAIMFTGCQQLQQLSQNVDFQKAVSIILTNVIQNQGTTQNYSGTLSAQLLQKNANGEYVYVNGTGKKTPNTVNLSLTTNPTAASMVIPTITIDGATMSAVQLANLANANGTITVGNNTTADATLTVGGKAYPISAVYFDGCTVNDKGSFNGTMMQIYFGSNSEYVADMTFSGKVAK